MSSLAFSPSFICTTPSSQPSHLISIHGSLHLRNCSALTLDDASDTNRCLERSTASGGVELVALLLGLASRAQPAGVLHGDAVALLGGRAVALADDGLLDTHVADGGCEESGCGLCDALGIEEGSHGRGVWVRGRRSFR